MELLAHEAVFADEVGDLFLEAVVLLHEELVHGGQLAVHSLEPGGLFALLLAAPPVLEPDLDLLRLDVRQDRALPDQLLPPHRRRLRALRVHSLQRLHLLRRVADVLPALDLVVGFRALILCSAVAVVLVVVLVHAASAAALSLSLTLLLVMVLMMTHHHRHLSCSI